MSGNENTDRDQPVTGQGQRQPILLLPAAVTALCVVLIAIEALRAWILNPQSDLVLVTWLAFFPYRLIDPGAVEGGALPIVWTSFTHAFLHGGWDHLLLNVVWLAIFGTPIANRYGGGPMLIVFFAGAAMGAFAFAATTLPEPQILIGASGGIAGLTGAAVRFIFQPPVIAVDPETGERRILGRRLATIGDVLRSPSARFFSIVWLVLNGIVPLLPALTGMDIEIAWQAHIGGFLAGFLLVPLFERRR
ncbi:MAG TPA: rhomboid family intramembrane serine protease [Devosia sp.]|nr:rhomboid family intramembrane serine protease [Devosia sp.]